MALIPFILDLADELHEFTRCLANGIDINDFGFGLYTGTDQQQQQQSQTSPRRSRASSFSSFWMPSKRHHPYNRIKTAYCTKSGEEAVANPEKSDTGSSSLGGTPGKSASYSVVNKNGFQVSMNVKQFAPNELSVKTIDNCIVVEGRHDDKEDGHGVISRHFVRKYMLPKGYDPNDVLSTLSSDGILTVKAPPPTTKNYESSERLIEIQPAPGPTPVLEVSAKETTKKSASSPSIRLECQLPEKRQKLALSPEPEESKKKTALKPPAARAENESHKAAAPLAQTEFEPNGVETEKTDEKVTEFEVNMTEKQQTPDVAQAKNDVEKKAEIILQTEKLLEKEQEETSDETEKKLLDECMPEAKGDIKDVCEAIGESSSVALATENTNKINEISVGNKNEKSIENLTKMDVDGEEEANNDDDNKMEDSDVFVATTKMPDGGLKKTATVTANDFCAKNIDTESEKTNNTGTSRNTTITTTITANNSSTNVSSNTTTTTNNSSPEIVIENSIKDGNGVVTGEIPVDIPVSDNCDAATATANKKTDEKVEFMADGFVETETAVLCSDTTTSIIDEVALLKAATTGPATITDNTDENVILTEPIDGISTDLSTTTTTVENVDCSLFAKKTHLGNGNNNTATPLVSTEEMAN